MKKLFQSRAFIIGFISGVLFLIVINCLNYLSNRGSIIGEPFSFGYPFDLYKGQAYKLRWENGFVNFGEILYLGLIADILFTIILSVLIGLIFKFIWSKFAERKLK